MWTEKDREKYKDDGRRYPSDLTDVEWSIIEPLFRGYFTFTADMREVVNASGIPSFFTLISLADASTSGSHVSRASSSTQNCQIHMIA